MQALFSYSTVLSSHAEKALISSAEEVTIIPVDGSEAERLTKAILAMPDDIKRGLRSLLEN